MTQEKTTPHNVPKLRFPEFRDAGAWEKKLLGQVVKFLDGQRKPIKESDRASIQGQYPYYGASGVIDYINDFIFDETLILLGEDGENIVSRNLPLVFKISGKCWVNNHAHVLRPKELHSLDFLVQYLESLSYMKYNSSGAQPKLNQAVCKTIPLLLPSPSEQQKIADCLSSIDELITTYAQKFDTLKAHKKGLIQQFFPAEGEIIPELRFPDFRDAGAWEEKKLKEISVINQGLQIPISKRFTEKVENSYFYITNEFLKENSNKFYYIKNPSESVICDEVDILMTRTGNTGQVVTNVRGVFHNNFFKIKYTNEINKGFFVYFLRSENIQNTILKLAGSSTIPDLNHSDFYRIEIKLPPLAEQQKIADCLSCIDELIAAQAQKIDTLKTHKKGLMQQLFPAHLQDI